RAGRVVGACHVSTISDMMRKAGLRRGPAELGEAIPKASAGSEDDSGIRDRCGAPGRAAPPAPPRHYVANHYGGDPRHRTRAKAGARGRAAALTSRPRPAAVDVRTRVVRMFADTLPRLLRGNAPSSQWV